MRITVLAIGHKMPSWIEEGFREYTKRMPPEARVELIELKPGKDKDDEGRKLLEVVVLAHRRLHHVSDYVARVHQDPVAGLLALGADDGGA